MVETDRQALTPDVNVPFNYMHYIENNAVDWTANCPFVLACILTD